MKKTKFALLLCLAMSMFSCEGDDKPMIDDVDLKFTGAMTVTPPMGDAIDVDNVVIMAEVDEEDKTVDIVLQNVSFRPGAMPPQIMELDDVPYTLKDGVVSVSVASVVPEIGDAPYPAYTMTDFKAEISKKSMSMNFSCIGNTVVYLGDI